MAPIPGIGATTGPQIFGLLLNYMLTGALIVQVYHYYISFPNDRLRIQVFVYTVFVLEIAQTILMGYSAYKLFGSGYGDLVALNQVGVDWINVCILGSIIPGAIQLFYSFRIYSFSKSKIVASVIAVLAVVQMVAGIVQGAFSEIIALNSNLTTNPSIVIVWMSSGALCDILIAGFMAYYLIRARPSTLSATMQSTLARLIRYTVETGTLTAIVALCLLILVLARPANDYYAVPSRALAKLYSNSLLVLLNARAVVKGGRADMASTEVLLNNIKFDTETNVIGEPPKTEGTEPVSK